MDLPNPSEALPKSPEALPLTEALIVPVREPIFEVYQCPECPWFRVRHISVKWNVTKIDHPQYGQVNGETAFNLDVSSHNCKATRAARLKHGFDPNLEYPEKYEQRVENAKHS